MLTAKPGRSGDLTTLLLGLRENSRAEAGNLKWDVWTDKTNPDRFVLDELYTDDAAAASHRETPHFKHYLANVGFLADRVALLLDPVKVE
jgi:quinol monooxygenase YgiN